MYCTGMWCCAWGKRLFLCGVVVVLWLGRCGGLTRKVGILPTLRGGPHAVAAPATWTDLLGAHAEGVPDCSSYLLLTPCGCTRARSTCVLHRDVVLCVGQASLPVWCCGFFVAGALRRIHAEALLPPDPKGWISAVAAPATWTDLLGARAERVPDCSSYLSRIPWFAADSRLSIHPRDSVDRAASAASSRKRVSTLY